MKLIEISVLILLSPLFLKIFASSYVQFSKIHEKNAVLESSFSKDFFAVSSFEKFCVDFSDSFDSASSENFSYEEKISELEKMCSAFGIEKIRIFAAGYADGKILLKCSWKNGRKENYRFAVVPEK